MHESRQKVSLKDWQDTALWLEIEHREPRSRAFIVMSTLMPIVQETLRAGIPASPDFTLHDNEHGFRVAQLAADLLGNEGVKQLSDVELSLLLLASYCHDIGMSPAREKVRNHYNYLLTGDDKLLTTGEARDLQKWLDSHWEGLTPSVEKDTITSGGLLLAEEINAY